MNSKIDIHTEKIIESYDVHTSLFSKIIEGIIERDLHHFIPGSNQIPWLIGSQVQLRYEAASWMGINKKQKAEALFRNNKEVQHDITYPSVTSFNEDWKRISPILRNAILELDDEDLFTYSEKEPGKRGTFYDLLSHIIQRETNCIAMITLWRGILT
ncbi:DinB family protein [Pedobacter cryoconitis]|uniref:DinB family protein n=1 Tax=Pedobacter cryoconitis TaxID=188932 RepID=A0A7X0J0G4_9SPHI|nr:DinB family protein [Pedobacter cryoconitis]MBB6498763.1 hypothetical protein [Pedobacter cryoconitis]